MPVRKIQGPHGPLAVVDDGGSPRPTVVLLHGLGGDHVQALAQVPQDLAPEIRRVAVDMRAHGDTSTIGPRESLTIDDFSRDVEVVLEELVGEGSGPLVLAGVSMGAAVTLTLALRRADLLAGIVLIRPAPQGSRVFQVLGQVLEEQGTGGLKAFTATPEYQEVESASAVVAASLRKQFDRPDAERRAPVLSSIPASDVPGYADLELLSGLRLPCLVLGAPDDPVHVLAHAKAVAQALPEGTFHELPRKELQPGAHEDALKKAVGAFVRECVRDR